MDVVDPMTKSFMNECPVCQSKLGANSEAHLSACFKQIGIKEKTSSSRYLGKYKMKLY